MASTVSSHRYPTAGVSPITSAHEATSQAAASSWKAEILATAFVVAIAVLVWIPRVSGPIDLRWDGAVYYILGTSLAEGKGYKLLNEPGDIDAVQYPPVLPAIVAGHALLAGSTDPTTVGRWLRLTSFLLFIAYAVLSLRFLKGLMRLEYAVLGSVVSVFCLYAWFLSDALFPEIWFSVATLLFMLSARHQDNPKYSALTYIWAVVGYGVRTIGLAAFAAWIVESVLRRRFRQAALRVVLALIPVVTWQLYIASVERQPQYQNPPYPYQRAAYLFYNVSYARNIALRDPFTPTKGPVQIERRIARNALTIAGHLGEALSVPHRYFENVVHAVVGRGPTARLLVFWTVFALLSVYGGVLAFGGIGLQLLRGHLVEPLYLLATIAALCLVPFPDQAVRYFMPVTPLLVAGAILLLSRFGRRAVYSVLVPVIAIQLATLATVYATEYHKVDQVDVAGKRLNYRLFFYDEQQRQYDEAIDYIRQYAAAEDIVAAGMPHWIHLRTGLKTVMPPFEADPVKAQELLDTVPVRYLVVGADVIESERFTIPVVNRFQGLWRPVYSTRTSAWQVYKRVG